MTQTIHHDISGHPLLQIHRTWPFFTSARKCPPDFYQPSILPEGQNCSLPAIRALIVQADFEGSIEAWWAVWAESTEYYIVRKVIARVPIADCTSIATFNIEANLMRFISCSPNNHNCLLIERYFELNGTMTGSRIKIWTKTCDNWCALPDHHNVAVPSISILIFQCHCHDLGWPLNGIMNYFNVCRIISVISGIVCCIRIGIVCILGCVSCCIGIISVICCVCCVGVICISVISICILIGSIIGNICCIIVSCCVVGLITCVILCSCIGCGIFGCCVCGVIFCRCICCCVSGFLWCIVGIGSRFHHEDIHPFGDPTIIMIADHSITIIPPVFTPWVLNNPPILIPAH